MRTNLLITAFLFCSVQAVGINAQPIRTEDGNDLLVLCARGSEMRQQSCPAYIMGWIRGFHNGFEIASSFAEASKVKLPSLVCMPETVKSAQMVDVVVAYLERNPAKRHQDAGLLILDAMLEAFPCR